MSEVDCLEPNSFKIVIKDQLNKLLEFFLKQKVADPLLLTITYLFKKSHKCEAFKVYVIFNIYTCLNHFRTGNSVVFKAEATFI